MLSAVIRLNKKIHLGPTKLVACEKTGVSSLTLPDQWRMATPYWTSRENSLVMTVGVIQLNKVSFIRISKHLGVVKKTRPTASFFNTLLGVWISWSLFLVFDLLHQIILMFVTSHMLLTYYYRLYYMVDVTFKTVVFFVCFSPPQGLERKPTHCSARVWEIEEGKFIIEERTWWIYWEITRNIGDK